MFTNRFIWILTLMLVSGSLARGQNQKKLTDADYASYPHWLTMMQDPQGNFFETQKAFNQYWKDREIPKEETGYSLFKRWEYLWQSGINPDGTFPEPDHVYKEFNKFVNSHPQDGNLKTGPEAWRELGPKSRKDNSIACMGRLNAIAFHPTDPATIYIGAPTGGFWATHDGGRSWTTATDNQPVMGVSAILVDPVNPDIILIGSGDRDNSNSPGGMGVFRSEDGGLTWAPFNKGMGNVTVGMFARSAGNPQAILAACNGGIFKTADGGVNWLKTSLTNANFTDIRFKPGTSTIAYATSPNGFYRSENAGDTWSLVPASSGYLAGDRIVIGVTPANDSLVYLIRGSNSNLFFDCFLSRDFGLTFTHQSSSTRLFENQFFYDLCIHVDPINPRILFVGAMALYRSIDGGKSWQDDLMLAPVHADQHALAENPLNNRLYVGNDGGIYYSDNGGTTWINISTGLGIGQIYKIGVSANDKDLVMAGFQDNANALWDGRDWTTLNGADGMECIFDPTDSRYCYVSSQYGMIGRLINFTSYRNIAGPNVVAITDKGAWITPFILSENDGNTMVVGFQNIWISRNIRSMESIQWRKISDNLTSSTFNTLEQSPVDNNVLYAASNGGKLFRTDNLLDKEVIWTLLPPSLPVSGGQPYIDIECHPFDANTVYLVNNKKVYKSANKGFTLQDITGSLPDIPLNTIVYDKSSNEGLYVGSDAGVYYKDADMTDWVLYGKSIPVSVKVSELEIYYDPIIRQGSRLRASTYGRGMWEIGLAEINPVPPGQLMASVRDESVKLNWNPPFYIQNIQGYRVYRNGSSIATINALTFTDQAIEKDVTQYYTVTTLYQGGGESGFSNEVFVTLISPVVLPYNQTFEKGTGGWIAKFYLDGWNYGNSEQLGLTGRDGRFFGIGSLSGGTGILVSDYLQTPEIDLSSCQGKTVTLNFAYAVQKRINYDQFSVVYRPAPDSAWVTLKTLEPPGNTSWVWDTTEINLPEKALTPHARIGFLFDNSKQFARGAAVDDVRIFANTTSVNTVDNKNWVRVFPNPTTGQVTLELNSLLPDQVRLMVYSSSGQVVLEKTISCHSGITRESIDLSPQPEGIYLLNLRSKSGGWKQKKTVILYSENEGRK